MHQTKLITMFLLCLLVCETNGQDLYDWKGKAGHTTKAAFLKVDEATRKVILLVPKEIDFEKLDDDSITLARMLASAPSEARGRVSVFGEDSPSLSFLKEKYAELIRLKSTPDFAKWGFSTGGPYHGWMKSVQEEYRLQKPIDLQAINSGKQYVSTGIGELQSLGLEYLSTKGKENKATAFFKGTIENIINGKPEPDRPSDKKPSNGFAEFQYVDDDGFPDVHAFSTLEQITGYWRMKDHKSTYSPQERRSLGIELLETKTKVKVNARIPFESTFIFEVVPLSGRHQGRTLFVIKFDLYETLR